MGTFWYGFSKLRTSLIVGFLMLLFAVPAVAKVCAYKFSDLDLTEKLKELRPLLTDKQAVGFVNQTQGSYFIITSHTDHFSMVFFTTGLFDLYGIEKKGNLVFCDTETGLWVDGLDRNEPIQIQNNQIIWGNGGPRETFQRGPVPQLIAEKNSIDLSLTHNQ